MRLLPAALVAAFSALACVPPAIPHGSTLTVQTDTVRATVLADGRVLGTTPLRVRLHNRATQRLTLAAAGHDTAQVTVRRRARPLLIGRINPFTLAVDDAAGRGWRGTADTLELRLRGHERLDDAVLAEVLTRMADRAQAAGCEPLLVDGWRDAALQLRHGTPAAAPDSVGRLADEAVESAMPRVRDLCARPSERVERMRAIREIIERGAPPSGEGPPFAPVFFDSNRWTARDDSVRARLQALGRRWAAAHLPVRLVVEGYTDPSGTEALNHELGYARANWVIAELRRGGLPAECCMAVSRGPDPAAAAGGRAGWPRARRVVFSLDYQKEEP
ncbi:MAG TPA: hypothetical protein VFJ82_10710 [Longimicrobium sp.]|nr:hypothetical protein [Longimicrobium sp.]